MSSRLKTQRKSREFVPCGQRGGTGGLRGRRGGLVRPFHAFPFVADVEPGTGIIFPASRALGTRTSCRGLRDAASAAR